MSYCIELNGIRWCPPLLVRERWWEDPNPPDPPYKWLDERLIPEEFQKDFAILSVIQSLSKALSPARAKVVGNALQETLREVPKGVKVTAR